MTKCLIVRGEGTCSSKSQVEVVRNILACVEAEGAGRGGWLLGGVGVWIWEKTSSELSIQSKNLHLLSARVLLVGTFHIYYII